MARIDRTGNRKSREQRYSKADSMMYEKLCKAGDEEKAIQIAQQKLEQCKREGKTKPSEMCPCTTVHELVEEINKKSKGEKSYGRHF
ncbi:MAG: hypothetical protein J6K43_16610 [Lachnospiraceae bacterium]|nr:hypothetical protein [Lachnospiraceae bacterium]